MSKISLFGIVTMIPPFTMNFPNKFLKIKDEQKEPVSG
jgi:hypothetical protein